VLTRHEHPSLLRTAGFTDIEETDVTDDYLRSVRAWFVQSSLRETQLRAVLGDALFEERQTDRRHQASAIEGGQLRRSLFVARARQEGTGAGSRLSKGRSRRRKGRRPRRDGHPGWDDRGASPSAPISGTIRAA
jgi:hypothetical protein